MNPLLIRTLVACSLCGIAFPARAQIGDPLLGKDRFPQYRNLSGLAGGTYGSDAEGYASLSGPVAFSTPTAHVLGHDRFRIDYGQASHGDALNLFDADHSNGSLALAFGHTFGQFNIAYTEFLKSTALDQAYNLQVELVPLRNRPLAFSIGVQDGTGTGGSAGEGLPTDRRSSRSIFGVVTYRLDTGRRPIYFSAGYGSRRFSQGFGSVSYQFARPLRAYVEHDGFGFNEGVVFTFKPNDSRRGLEFNAGLGLQGNHYLTATLGVGF